MPREETTEELDADVAVAADAQVDDIGPRAVNHHRQHNDDTGMKEHWREKWHGKWFLKCPRCWALLLGVILPLWLLVAVSFGFGKGLALFEAKPELDASDKIMRDQALALFSTASTTRMTQRLPVLCLEEYASSRTIADISNDLIIDILPNKTISGNFNLNFSDPSAPVASHDYVLSNYIQTNPGIAFNLTELLHFLQSCSRSSAAYVEALIGGVTTTASTVRPASDLSFYWNRCPLENRTASNETYLDGILHDSLVFEGVTSAQRKGLKPSRQYKRYWNKDAAALYFKELNQTDLSNMNQSQVAEAKFSIFLNIIEQATGDDGCYTNTVASVWFWFTVMTTIGYGNQTPMTWQGQTLFYTVGFLNILLFGAVTASAGYVLSSLVNDLVSRCGIPLKSRPWITCVFWAVVLYLWMLVIAFIYQQWKYYRLGLDITLSDAYWFSYVSTTTIGLGNLVLDPEVLVIGDLLIFPVLLLISFSFFGSFIADLGSALYTPFDGQDSFVAVLKDCGILRTEAPVYVSRARTKLTDTSTHSSEMVRESEDADVSTRENVLTGTWQNVA